MGCVIRCGDGLAVGVEPERAIELAITEASLPLGDLTPDLACVFVSGLEPDEAERALAEASELTGAPTVVGCSADGVLGAGQAVEGQPAVSVWVVSAPELRLRSFHLEVIRTDTAMTVVGMPELEDASAGLLLVDPWTLPRRWFRQPQQRDPARTAARGRSGHGSVRTGRHAPARRRPGRHPWCGGAHAVR